MKISASPQLEGMMETVIQQKESDKILELIKAAPWKVITPQLLKYSVFKVKRLEWNTGDFLPKGLLAEDVAYDAIRKTCEGVRKWDPEKYPELLEFLKSVVDSDVHALVESAEHKLTNYSAQLSSEEASQVSVQMIDASMGVRTETSPRNAEQFMLRREADLRRERRFNRLFETLLLRCGDDEEEMLMLVAYREAAQTFEKVKPALVAKYAGLDEKRARNALRRIERKVTEINREMSRSVEVEREN